MHSKNSPQARLRVIFGLALASWLLVGTAVAALAQTPSQPTGGGSATPSGPAGGDLTGTYPNPNVSAVGGGALPAHAVLVDQGSSPVTTAGTGTNCVVYQTAPTVDPTCATTVTLGGNLTAQTISANTSYRIGANAFASATLPTITSGFGTTPTAPSSANSNGSLAFQVTVGTGGTATSGVLAMPTAPHGWNCQVIDETTLSSTVFVTKQTADTVSSVTVGNFTNSAAAAAWTAGDLLLFTCVGR